MEVEEKVVREELNMGDREVVKVSEEVKKKVYVVPTKQVKTVADIALWEASQAYQVRQVIVKWSGDQVVLDVVR